MGSLNWASGLIPLGHLYLRPLQRYFHSLGLTDRFMPPRRSDPSVLASLLQLWQDLSFLTSGIPIRPFQADFTIITDASTQGWGAHMGIPKFWVHALGPSGPPAPYQLLGTQGGRGCSTSLGPSDDRHGQLNSSFLYQQTRRDLVLHLVTSGSGAFYVVTSSEHSCPSKAHPRLSERHSRPPISSQSADIDRVESPSLNRESNFHSLGDPSSGHVCNCFKLPPSSVHVSDSRAKSPGGGCSVSGLAGEVDVHMFSPFPLLSKVIQKLWSTQEAEVILIAPWWPKQAWFPHLLCLCVDHPLFFPYRRDLLSQQDQRYISDGKSYHLHAWRLSCDTTGQQAFQTRSLGLPRHLGDPQPIVCTTIGGSASPDGLQGRALTRLIPQLLKWPPFYIPFLTLACLPRLLRVTGPVWAQCLTVQAKLKWSCTGPSPT